MFQEVAIQSNAHVADLKCHVSVDRVKIDLEGQNRNFLKHRGPKVQLNLKSKIIQMERKCY